MEPAEGLDGHQWVGVALGLDDMDEGVIWSPVELAGGLGGLRAGTTIRSG